MDVGKADRGLELLCGRLWFGPQPQKSNKSARKTAAQLHQLLMDPLYLYTLLFFLTSQHYCSIVIDLLQENADLHWQFMMMANTFAQGEGTLKSQLKKQKKKKNNPQ